MDFVILNIVLPPGTKRGYILQTTLAHKTRGILGKVNQDTSAYFGASTSFLKSGGVFADEYVVVLDRETSSKYSTLWYYVEFNAASGRKRGYVNQSDVTLCGTGASLDDLKIGDHLAVAKMDLTVYSGPSESYARVGTISETERVGVYEGRSQESEYAFIEYCTPAGPKMGYVPAGQLLKTSFGIPVPNTTNYTDCIWNERYRQALTPILSDRNRSACSGSCLCCPRL